jgi:patatin-like phospholipase/acyl hydrolase
MPRPFRILSIDGGGIRGLIPALVLQDIERATGRRTAELFDLIAGTSTGGILALALTRPGADGRPAYSASDLVELYEQEGDVIFSRSVWHRARALGNAFEEKYPTAPVERVLEQYFGETRLSQALSNVLVTAYELEERRPFFFKSHNARVNPADDFPMRLAARATSAAPTYFEPARVPVLTPPGYQALVDGGVYANNPAMCAYVETLCKWAPESIALLSLGTGEAIQPIPYRSARDWGLVNWAQPILNVVFDGVSDTVDYQLRNLTSSDTGKLKAYWRLQTRLQPGQDAMDDASEENLRTLRESAEALIAHSPAALAQVCNEVMRQGPIGPIEVAVSPLP